MRKLIAAATAVSLLFATSSPKREDFHAKGVEDGLPQLLAALKKGGELR